MFGRLNLARVNCERLRIVAHPTLAPSLAEEILQGSESHPVAHEGRRVVYGTLYIAKGKPHSVRALVTIRDGSCHVELLYEARALSPRPRDIRSVVALVKILKGQRKQEFFEATGTFSYRMQDDWESKIPLPQEAPVNSGFSRLDGVNLSQREQGHRLRSIHIYMDDDDRLRHVAYVTFQDHFSKGLALRALRETRKLSRAWVSEKGKA